MEGEFNLTENLGKGEINYGKIVFIQIARINYLGSRAIQKNKEYREEWENSIISLEGILSPKIKDDDKWDKEKKEIEGDNPKIKEWRKFFKKLMKLAQDADLLPAEHIDLYDEGLNPIR